MARQTAADSAARTEAGQVPSGGGERFAGYGVMGLPFTSGRVLAMRRFPASSIGPAYTSVWHRDPDGRWAFWQDQADGDSCPRYFSNAVQETRRVAIELTWPGPSELHLVIPELDFAWTARLTSTPATRLFSALGRVMPDRAWHSSTLLTTMGPLAGAALRAGRVAMTGAAPNGQDFVAKPIRMWVIDDSTARLGVDDFGALGPLDHQARLGDFWIPQRGVFVVGRVSFTAT